MLRLLVGTCVLALAVVVARADDEKKDKEKSPREAYQAMFKELVAKYKAAKNDTEKQELLSAYAEKFVDLARKNPKDAYSVTILEQVLGLPLQESKDKTKAGPMTQAAALLKKVIDSSDDKKLRGQALTAYLGAQEKVVTGSKDAKAVAAAKKEMDTYRKVIEKDFKGQIKDLFIGAQMPDLKGKNLEDKDAKLSDLKGKVVVLDIWATWCPPCRAMIPHEREMVKKLKDKPFVLISISADAKKDTLTNFLKDNDMPWTHWWDGQGGKIGSELNVRYYPTIYVLDGKGVIRYKDVRGKQMDDAVEALLKETEDKTKPKS